MPQGKTYTASNGLSILRIFLLIPIWKLLSLNTESGNLWALLLMFVAVISDFFDGFLARRFGQVSDLGKVLDPLADKICILGVYLILASPVRENPLPYWFLLVMMIRELIVLTGGYLLYRRQRIIVKSNIWGKTTSTILALMLISCVLKLETTSFWLYWLNCQFLLWLSLSFMLVATFTYGARFFKLLGGQKRVVQSRRS